MLEFQTVYQYEICIEGHLDQRRLANFENATMTLDGECTKITAVCPDQAALYGLLNWLRDLAIPLISVQRQEFVNSK